MFTRHSSQLFILLLWPETIALRHESIVRRARTRHNLFTKVQFLFITVSICLELYILCSRLVMVFDFDLRYEGGYRMRYHVFCSTVFAVFAFYAICSICGICGIYSICGIISVAVFAVMRYLR